MLNSRSLLVVGAIVTAGLVSGFASAADYRVRDLLQPCVEGDNDSRGGQVMQMECEQYISGFTDLYLRRGSDKTDGVCLPAEGNRATEVRWAFMRWANEHIGKRDIAAVDGLLETLKTRFKCK